MKHFFTFAVLALSVLCGVAFSAQTSSAASNDSVPYYNMPYNSAPYNGVPNNSYPFVNRPNYYGGQMYYSPAVGTQAPNTHMTPTQVRTGYTRGEIRAMPLIERPNRPGHFIGNTIRRRSGF